MCVLRMCSNYVFHIEVEEQSQATCPLVKMNHHEKKSNVKYHSNDEDYVTGLKWKNIMASSNELNKLNNLL